MGQGNLASASGFNYTFVLVDLVIWRLTTHLAFEVLGQFLIIFKLTQFIRCNFMFKIRLTILIFSLNITDVFGL